MESADRDAAIEAIRVAATEERFTPEETDYHRFLECQQLQQASSILANACAELDASRRATAFTARTFTPLHPPPGWLPPPI